MAEVINIKVITIVERIWYIEIPNNNPSIEDTAKIITMIGTHFLRIIILSKLPKLTIYNTDVYYIKLRVTGNKKKFYLVGSK